MNTNQHKLIFCINSGRSGSNYLADLLGTAREVTSFHEAEPTMSGKYLHNLNKASYAETFDDRRIKSEAIGKILLSLPPGRVYCETNHMFIKTFYDVILNDFENVEVIILRRQLVLVLKSFIELNYFTSANAVWPDWMSSPHAKTAAIPCIASESEMDQYDLCIAYLVDIEARSERFKQEYPWVRTHEIRLEALNNYNNVLKLFRDLNMIATRKTKKVTGRIVNARTQTKKDCNNLIQLSDCHKRIEEFLAKARAKGISLPQNLALDPYE